METLLYKVQQDILARRQPRAGFPSRLAMVAGAGILCVLAFQLGARFGAGTPNWSARENDPGQRALQRVYIERLERVQKNSARYGIGADLAASIEDIASAEGVDPRIAFGLVRVESEFRQNALSPRGAVGYTQLMPATARLLAPGIRREQMFERETNLRLGFRFLRSLVVHYDGNLHLALTAYNRGPVLVDRMLARGMDPSNGYADRVLRADPDPSGRGHVIPEQGVRRIQHR